MAATDHHSAGAPLPREYRWPPNLEHVLRDEVRIVWCWPDRSSKFEGAYVREEIVFSPSRTGRPRWHTGRLVAYAELRDGAQRWRIPGESFQRRVWYVRPHDRSECDDGPYATIGAPVEAVDPSSIRTGQPSLTVP